jgi:hypothetical protein
MEDEMLEGKDFMILSTREIGLLFDALKIRVGDKATYKELSALGILEMVNRMKKHLYPDEEHGG